MARRPAVIRLGARRHALATQPAPYARRTCARAQRQRGVVRWHLSFQPASFRPCRPLDRSARLRHRARQGLGPRRTRSRPARRQPAPPRRGRLPRAHRRRRRRRGRAHPRRPPPGRRARRPAVARRRLGDACAPADAWSPPRRPALARVARAHQAAGGPSFAVLGAHEWRCGAPELTLRPGRSPTSSPGAARGQLRAARRSEDGATGWSRPAAHQLCAVDAAGPDALVDLVLVDTAAWQGPPPTPLRRAADASLAEQQALLAALEAAPSDRPAHPRDPPPDRDRRPARPGRPPPRLRLLPAQRAAAPRHRPRRVRGRALGPRPRPLRHRRHLRRDQALEPLLADPPVLPGRLRRDRPPRRRAAAGAAGSTIRARPSSPTCSATAPASPSCWSAPTPTPRSSTSARRAAGAPRSSPSRAPGPPHPAETPSPVMDPCLYCDPLPPRQ
jgi:hypothetical protein